MNVYFRFCLELSAGLFGLCVTFIVLFDGLFRNWDVFADLAAWWRARGVGRKDSWEPSEAEAAELAEAEARIRALRGTYARSLAELERKTAKRTAGLLERGRAPVMQP